MPDRPYQAANVGPAEHRRVMTIEVTRLRLCVMALLTTVIFCTVESLLADINPATSLPETYGETVVAFFVTVIPLLSLRIALIHMAPYMLPWILLTVIVFASLLCCGCRPENVMRRGRDDDGDYLARRMTRPDSFHAAASTSG